MKGLLVACLLLTPCGVRGQDFTQAKVVTVRASAGSAASGDPRPCAFYQFDASAVGQWYVVRYGDPGAGAVEDKLNDSLLLSWLSVDVWLGPAVAECQGFASIADVQVGVGK